MLHRWIIPALTLVTAALVPQLPGARAPAADRVAAALRDVKGGSTVVIPTQVPALQVQVLGKAYPAEIGSRSALKVVPTRRR